MRSSRFAYHPPITVSGGDATGAAGGELTGTFPNPSVATTHSGSSHAGIQAAATTAAETYSDAAAAAHVAASDPHTGYLRKSLGVAKGDVIVYNGTSFVRLPVGADSKILTADATLFPTNGVGWGDPPVGGGGGGAATNLHFVTTQAEASLSNETALANVEVRSLHGMSGVVEITDTAFAGGAVGTDTGDQTAAIQAAVDALPSAGGVVQGPVGRYRCTGTIHVDGKGSVVFRGLGGRSQGAAGFVLAGRGGGVTLVSCTKGGDPIATHSGHEFYNIRFEDSTIDDFTTSNVSATWTGGVATFTSNNHPFLTGETLFTNRNSGTTQWRALVIGPITKTGANTFTASMANPGVSGSGLQISLETLPAVSQRLLVVNGQTRWYVERCAFFGGFYGFEQAGSNDTSWGKGHMNTYDFCGVGAKISTTGGQSVVHSGGNLLLKSGQVGFQGPDPADSGFDSSHDDAAHFRAYGMKFDTQNCSGDGSKGFDIRNAIYVSIGPFVSFEMEGDCIGLNLGGGGKVSGRIGGINFQHNETKTGKCIVLTGADAGSNIEGLTIEGNQAGGAGWSEYVHVAGFATGLKIKGGNCSSASTAIFVETSATITGMSVDNLSLTDSGSTLLNAPATADIILENCYDVNQGWVGLAGGSFKRLGSNATKTSDTAFTTLTALSLPLVANAIYYVDIVLFYNTNSIADMQLRFNGIPTGAAVTWGVNAITNAAASSSAVSNFGDVAGNAAKVIGGLGAGGVPGSTDLIATIRALVRVGSTAGTLTFQWGQNVSDAGQSVIYADSHRIARRVL